MREFVRTSPCTAVIAAGVIGGMISPAALAQPTVTSVPRFDVAVVPLTASGTSNQARGVNDAGLVTGYDNIPGGSQRLIVSDGTTSTDAGLPAYSTTITSAEGHAINAGGVVAGVGRYSAPAPGSTTGSVPYDRGIVYNAATSRYLAVLEPFNDAGGRRAFAQAVNDAHRVVGNASNDPVPTNQNPRRAFWYDANPAQPLTTYKLDPAANGLPFLPGGHWNVAYDVNERQQIVGFAQTPDDASPTATNRNRAVIWDAGTPDAAGNPYTSVTRIDLRNAAGTSSIARAINDDGVVIGRMATSTVSDDETAFVYRRGDPSITSLGGLANPAANSTRTEAIDIASNGWIVGYAGATEGNSQPTNLATLWLPESDGGVAGYRSYDLNTLVTLGSVADGGFTRLLEARAVHDDGTIVGYGRFVATPGGTETTRGFVLTVPEPSSLAAAGLIGGALLRRRSGRERA